MTMTGRVFADQISDEFLPAEPETPWAHTYGAIDASMLIPCGSTVEAFKGRRGFGIPQAASRERGPWTTTAV